MVEAGSKEFLEVLELPSAEDYKADEQVEKVHAPHIEFQHVAFKYESSEPVIDDISFTISKNEMVALVGPSGAGKSTIVNLILKLYDSVSGSILMNGKNYQDLS